MNYVCSSQQLCAQLCLNIGVLKPLEHTMPRWTVSTHCQCQLGLTCTFKASCYSTRLSWAHRPVISSTKLVLTLFEVSVPLKTRSGLEPVPSCEPSYLLVTPSVTHINSYLLVSPSVLPCTHQGRLSPPLIPSPFFSCPGQRNQQRPVVPMPATGVPYNSLL